MPAAKTKTPKITLLLVEDDAFLAEIYRTKLEREGFRIVHAEDGVAGLKLAKKEKPALILLDVLMPKMDGFGVLAELKREPDMKSVPVIMLTNLGQKEDVERGLKLGAADYLIKSHTLPSDAVARIRKLLEATKG